MSALAPRVMEQSPLARRNPTVKLLLLLLVSLSVLFVLDPVTPAVLYVLALIAVWSSARIPARRLALAHTPFVVFALGVLVVNALSRPGVVLWQAGVLRVTSEGLSVGAALALRTLLIGVLAIGFLASTDAVALVTSLHQNAHLSARVTYAVLAGYRMLQEMPREWATIRNAHAVRRPLTANERPAARVAYLAGVAFTLLVVSVRKGERMAQALECRGLGLQPRTTWRPVPVQRADVVLLFGVLAVLAIVVAGSAALGFYEGPSALLPNRADS